MPGDRALAPRSHRAGSMASLLDGPPTIFGDMYSDPRNAAVVGTAAGLLQASGPQRFPVSFGQAAGQGLLTGFNLMQEAEQARRRSALLNAQTEHIGAQTNVLNEQMAVAARQRDALARLAGGGG